MHMYESMALFYYGHCLCLFAQPTTSCHAYNFDVLVTSSVHIVLLYVFNLMYQLCIISKYFFTYKCCNVIKLYFVTNISLYCKDLDNLFYYIILIQQHGWSLCVNVRRIAFHMCIKVSAPCLICLFCYWPINLNL